MDNMDDSENNAKISDSAYSNSCSNSQSRRSSKSTHSGSNSSGSSGYGGKQSASGYSNNLNQPPEKRLKEKEAKKKKLTHSELTEGRNVRDDGHLEPAPIFESPEEDINNVVPMSSPALASAEKGSESMDIATSENRSSQGDIEPFDPEEETQMQKTLDCVINQPPLPSPIGFSCVISMHDGVVMYTTTTLTCTLGFPKDMWVGRSFIDFIHPRDRSALASQITNSLAIPKKVNGTQEKASEKTSSMQSMVCRIRRYRDLSVGFGLKSDMASFMPFLLKLSFKNVNKEDGDEIYLVIQATPFFTAFKIPNEVINKPVLFNIRHAADGNLEYIDPESVPYLGYLPQDIINKNALHLYHPHDLVYLSQVYETIVKEGGSPRSKPYRMMAQNGDYVKLVTEWSSFINPWSKKLEFVIGKHCIVEGPANPNVFQLPEPETSVKLSKEDEVKAQSLRDRIIKILNDVLTKPAEAVKKQMSKRCQDITKFMQTLLEDQPKVNEEIRLEVQDADHSYYERDSVMLGGISPHHECNDSKSSTETLISYNQLNYNENLQRYFESHPSTPYEEYNTVNVEKVLGKTDAKENTKRDGISPMVVGDTGECKSKPTKMKGVNSVEPLDDYQPVRLTESNLSKHNAKMVKELVKIHRENRSSSKGEKDKISNENWQKKKEHLARCNASFQPTTAGMNFRAQPHGIKRASKQNEAESGHYKHHCTSAKQTRRRQPSSTSIHQPTATPATTTGASTPWSSNPMNGFILGVGIPQQMPMVSPVAAMPGVFPLHYMPGPGPQAPASATANGTMPTKDNGLLQDPTMQCMMYGQAVYGSPFVYSPINPQVSYPVQQNYIPSHGVQYVNSINSLGLENSNYEQACKTSFPMKTRKSHFGNAWRARKRAEAQAFQFKHEKGSLKSNSSENASNMDSGVLSSDKSGNGKSQKNSSDFYRTSYSLKSTKAVHDTMQAGQGRRPANSEETTDKTDGESSYSSFYSSFFKTESGSAEESGENKKAGGKDNKTFEAGNYSESGMPKGKKAARRKMEPPWLEHVCVTSDLIYKYQIQTKSLEEVLASDKQKLEQWEQPSLVNEQLGQLYLDLQLEGVASRLTLEDGMTSSSSSGEETPVRSNSPRKKREYSKLVMIYEENAPLPPPDSAPPAPIL